MVEAAISSLENQARAAEQYEQEQKERLKREQEEEQQNFLDACSKISAHTALPEQKHSVVSPELPAETQATNGVYSDMNNDYSDDNIDQDPTHQASKS